ncbi:Phosphoribosyl-ATP diphosphatase, Phosphoribosyl-AMP cyclohydrolase [Zostera marina]|uniref:Phosphoribosyl-ATP diphosphatase, Phosphoribosyl-AMP cyclohydrolase n=1 Tax=Zostera marina TaxID=29655 RepID=A0A0K9PSI1_ZOSMR|nr:Phosphoribosyl-ATP diphosphatase, Phosphoribosyl-AMP cyclohydrolase [Zostera marina]
MHYGIDCLPHYFSVNLEHPYKEFFPSIFVTSRVSCPGFVSLPKNIILRRAVSSSAAASFQPSFSKDADGFSSYSEHPHQLNSKVDAFLESLKWDEKGLMVAIAQNVDTGAIMMQGFINKEALAKTISSQKATFYSRSRSSLWTKGETSTNFIHVIDIFFDCDLDSVIYLGKPDGPSCHTGSETCYFLSMSDVLRDPQAIEHRLALTTLYSLENIISQRRDEVVTSAKPSWTKRLLNDAELLCSKVREEAEELVQTVVEKEDSLRTASEMADLLYHAMVLLSLKNVKLEQVFEVLRNRFSQSGIDEKNSRRR